MTVTKDAAAPQFRTAGINNWCIWKQLRIRIQWLRDGLMQQQQQIHIQNIVMGWCLKVQEQCDGFSAKNEDVENLVGRQEGLMSYSTCQLVLLVRVFVLARLSPPGFPVSPLCCSESEDSSDLNSWIYSSNSLCSVSSFFMTLSGPMYYTLSLTVFKCTTCQQSKPHQLNRFFFAGSWILQSCL